jgi:bla regulator protein BlaR1
MSKLRRTVVALLLVVAPAAVIAKQFDVVSIKPVEPGRGAPPLAIAQLASASLCGLRGNRFTCSGSTVIGLIQLAFQTDARLLPQSQIVGGPDWPRTTQFNVTATIASDEPITQAQLSVAVRALLEDRFKLTAHVEPHSFPAYALVVARNDTRLGPQLRRSITDCPAPPNEMPAPPRALAGQPRCFYGAFRSGKIVSGSITMDALARNLTTTGGMDRIVVDRTGLSGKYDVDLRWSADVTQQSDEPPLVTAIQEQLGLKLEPRNEMLPAIVIDHIERPTEN